MKKKIPPIVGLMCLMGCDVGNAVVMNKHMRTTVDGKYLFHRKYILSNTFNQLKMIFEHVSGTHHYINHKNDSDNQNDPYGPVLRPQWPVFV